MFMSTSQTIMKIRNYKYHICVQQPGPMNDQETTHRHTKYVGSQIRNSIKYSGEDHRDKEVTQEVLSRYSKIT